MRLFCLDKRVDEQTEKQRGEKIMKKKSVLLGMLLAMGVMAGGCQNSEVTVVKPVKGSEKMETEKKETSATEKETVKTTENENSVSTDPGKTPEELEKQQETTANYQETAGNVTESTEQMAAKQPSETTSQPESEAADYPGPDTAVLVNLRGDTTTVYKLADGRYMDRINAIYIFDGTDTWYDESGVEWNEAVQTEGAAANVRDPYDLYSWDAETGTYIPYQEAEGTAEPIGRENGWFYYDAESGNYMPW